MHFMHTGEVAIHYRTIGLEAGKPVIAFVNSLGTDFRIWEPVIEVLGDAFGYVLHDKRGHGLSDLGPAPYAMSDHVSDLVALLDHVQVERAVIWGLSVGGMIAQGLYAERPDMVRALVLSNTSDKIGDADFWNGRIDRIMSEGMASVLDPVMERWFTPAFRQPDNALYAGACNMLLRQDPRGYCGTCAALRDADYRPLTGNIVVPTLCVAGDADGSTPPAVVRALADHIPEGRFSMIEDCGHIPCLQQPSAYAAAVGRFLGSLPEF